MNYNRATALLSILVASPIIASEFSPRLMEYRGEYCLICTYTGDGNLPANEDAIRMVQSAPGTRARLFVGWKDLTDAAAGGRRPGAASRAGTMIATIPLQDGSSVQAIFAYDAHNETAPFAVVERGPKGATRNGYVLRDVRNFAHAIATWIVAGMPTPDAPPVEVRNGRAAVAKRLDVDTAASLWGLRPSAAADLVSEIATIPDPAPSVTGDKPTGDKGKGKVATVANV